jgi:post-segregation antitoxin (ccd killing protein)
VTDFKKKPPKKNVTVRVDGNVIAKAKKKNINISEVCRHALELAVDGKFVTPGGA